MGSSASKEVDDTVLGECTLHKENVDVIFDGAVTETVLKHVKGKGSSYIDVETGKTLITFKDKGMMKKHTLIISDDRIVAYSIATKKGMASCTSFILREQPTFKGQEPIDGDSLAKAGLEKGMKLYGFAKIEMKKPSMTTATSIYSIVTGNEEFKVLYVAEKLSAMNFHCIVKTVDDVPILKASMKGISFHITAEVSAGVDISAAVLTGQSTFSTDGTAGGLVGAGVI